MATFCFRDELQIGGLFIRIYNEMPTYPIQNPKSFVIDLLEFLKQGYTFMVNTKTPARNIMAPGSILTPTLAANHPQKLKPSAKATEAVLNEYNRSKFLNQLEKTESSEKYDFNGNPKAVEHIIMVLKALISVIKSNENVEIQCIGHFEMLFGFLSTNFCDKVRSQTREMH